MHQGRLSRAINRQELCPCLSRRQAHLIGEMRKIFRFSFDCQNGLIGIKASMKFGQSTVDCQQALVSLSTPGRQGPGLPVPDLDGTMSANVRLNFNPGGNFLRTVIGFDRTSELHAKAPGLAHQFEQRRDRNDTWKFTAASQMQRQDQVVSNQQTVGLVAAGLGHDRPASHLTPPGAGEERNSNSAARLLPTDATPLAREMSG